MNIIYLLDTIKTYQKLRVEHIILLLVIDTIYYTVYNLVVLNKN